jgi:putative DNA primase/helicase
MNTDIDRIRSALFYLSADMPRNEWAAIAMALKSELGEDGFQLFDEWSRKSDKYNARDIRDTWRSCGPDGGITIATLFYKAKIIGWRYNGARPTPEEIDRGRRETAKRTAEEKAMKAANRPRPPSERRRFGAHRHLHSIIHT